MADHYSNADFYMRIDGTLADGDLVFLLTVGCGAVSLHVTPTIKADMMFTAIDYRNLSKFQASAGWFCLIMLTPLLTHTHTHTDPSPSH